MVDTAQTRWLRWPPMQASVPLWLYLMSVAIGPTVGAVIALLGAFGGPWLGDRSKRQYRALWKTPAEVDQLRLVLSEQPRRRISTRLRRGVVQQPPAPPAPNQAPLANPPQGGP